ncbi:protein-L-isoaspartate O-methyltransferase [Kitasatospora sp. MAP12-15]|uniref:methyltransferase domain-containing protein n=1 Tax=unclassified Kitasatospora TaxID=2633591 RepID=UPI0024767011|nr:methyltransferase domain-containing protein [Kitasatospora sp. MAP12-44]MDH6115175.1 protein-L-isoaspartate O-methyltransferase [Kitasatospora sp. MAP12-44]
MTLAPEWEDRPGRAPGRRLPDYVTPQWAAAFTALPRSLFLPDLMWAHDMATGRSRPLDRRTDPDAWTQAADADIPIVTQWDDGQHAGTEPGTVPTSSASMPSVVAGMLAELDPQPGQKVLNIGAGTGWDTALLAHRLGDANVYAVDVDPQVTADARSRLGAAGYRPTVICGDGRFGWKAGAAYDRVIVSCGLRQIPGALVEQTRPGGVILAPWGTHYGNADALVRLTVHDDGTAATGPFLRPVEFMKLRAHRLVWPEAPDAGGTVEESTTVATLPAHGQFDPFPFALGLRLPHATHAFQPHDDGARTLWLYSLAEPAWSAVTFRDGEPEHQVRQYGARRLWDEFEAAYAWWLGAGRPGFDRFGLTVDTAGDHRVWLDDPDQPVNQPGRPPSVRGA